LSKRRTPRRRAALSHLCALNRALNAVSRLFRMKSSKFATCCESARIRHPYCVRIRPVESAPIRPGRRDRCGLSLPNANRNGSKGNCRETTHTLPDSAPLVRRGERAAWPLRKPDMGPRPRRLRRPRRIRIAVYGRCAGRRPWRKHRWAPKRLYRHFGRRPNLRRSLWRPTELRCAAR
jgi:hypothetical protein